MFQFYNSYVLFSYAIHNNDCFHWQVYCLSVVAICIISKLFFQTIMIYYDNNDYVIFMLLGDSTQFDVLWCRFIEFSHFTYCDLFKRNKEISLTISISIILFINFLKFQTLLNLVFNNQKCIEHLDNSVHTSALTKQC